MVSHTLLKTPQECIHLLDASAMPLYQATKSHKGIAIVFYAILMYYKSTYYFKATKNHPAEKIQCKNKTHNLGVVCTTTVLPTDRIKTLVFYRNSM